MNAAGRQTAESNVVPNLARWRLHRSAWMELVEEGEIRGMARDVCLSVSETVLSTWVLVV